MTGGSLTLMMETPLTRRGHKVYIGEKYGMEVARMFFTSTESEKAMFWRMTTTELYPFKRSLKAIRFGWIVGTSQQDLSMPGVVYEEVCAWFNHGVYPAGRGGYF